MKPAKKIATRKKTAPRASAPPSEELLIGRDYLRMFRKSYVRLRAIASDLITPHGITTTQFLTLLSISDNSGLSQAALCLEVDSDANTVSQILRRLEKKCYVVRRKDPADGRAVRLFITPGGSAVVNKVLPDVDRLSLRIYATLPAQGRKPIYDLLQELSSIRDLQS